MRRPGRPAATPTLLAALVAAQLACGGGTDPHGSGGDKAERATGPGPVTEEPARDPLASLPLPLRRGEPRFGDFESMVERRLIRVVTTLSRTGYFLDGGRPRGATHEAMTAFETFINQRLGSGRLRVQVLVVPVARDQLLPAVLAGRADLAAANLTVTPQRRQEVTFSNPVLDGVRELVVTGPASPPLGDLEDLAGQEIHVRASSSHAESLERLNEDFARRGLESIEVHAADEQLETEDLIELVAVGALPLTVADSHIAELWREVLDGARVRDDLAIAEGRSIAWAMRPDTPRLAEEVDAFVAGHRQGTLFGNILLKRYFRSAERLRNPLVDAELSAFERLRPIFREFAERYGLDWLLVAAQAYQESRFDQSLTSSRGAVGIMQIKPSTAADRNVGISDISTPRDNIHAGVKYMRFLRDRYFDDPDLRPLDQAFFTLAAYNAGPARVARFRQRAEERGLDQNVWFRQVEQLASRQTVDYVSHIFKYWVAYREHLRRVQRLQSVQPSSPPHP